MNRLPRAVHRQPAADRGRHGGDDRALGKLATRRSIRDEQVARVHRHATARRIGALPATVVMIPLGRPCGRDG